MKKILRKLGYMNSRGDIITSEIFIDLSVVLAAYIIIRFVVL